MPHRPKIVFCSAVLAAGLAAMPAWALDVKTGLWEIRMEGMPDVQRSCFTRELLDADPSDFAAMEMPEGVTCKHEVKEQNAKRTVSHTTCTGPFAIEGDTRIEVQSPESMSMTSTSVVTIAGRQQTMTNNAQYKWLSSDCGDVKPVDLDSMLRD